MTWIHPKFEEHATVTTQASEVTPFVWKQRLYTLENYQRFMDFPGQRPDYRFHEDGCYIRDVETGQRLCYPWRNHYFSTMNVFGGRLVLVGGDYGQDRPWWHIKEMQMMTSTDLTTWSTPVTILTANERENLFNNAIVFDGRRFILLYETDDPAVRDAPVLRALEAERVETPQAGALAQEPADQADSGDGGDGFVSLCYINHGNLAGEWLMCFRQYT